MCYSIDEIYRLAGRDDKVTVLTFYPDTKAFIDYGENLTVVFHYDLFEREKLENKFKEGVDEKTYGLVKARYLGFEIAASKVEQLLKEGINSNEIQTIFTSPWSHDNLFHREEKRSIRTIEIPIRKEPKGGDYDWMYGFDKKLVLDGFELSPYEMDFYLGMKNFYEPNNFTAAEEALLMENGVRKEPIERHFLEVKSEKEIATPEEEKRLEELSIKMMNNNLEILKKELNDAGSNFAKLYGENPELCIHLMIGTYKYIPERLNGFEGKPIFLDWKGYLHVFTRHVEEFLLNGVYDKKDKFLWHPKDVITVIKKVIESIDKEVQEFWKNNPNSRYSKYGAQSLYFEGDYYTFHVEANGRLSTFHRSKKKI